MKLISFVIPSYNSEAYLNRAVDSILLGGEDVEILIINDGSTDNTGAIANAYAQRHPSIVRAIHKPNGGHGSGINAALKVATGLYFKVVDSDDWIEEQALQELLVTLKAHITKGLAADLYITNFVYDHVRDHSRFVRNWKKHFPVRRLCGWSDAKCFVASQVLLMHSLLYKTELLRASGLVLPEHTFYVDNIFAYVPLPYVKKLFYLDVNLYHYFIGRDDQSVNIHNFTKRYDQQIRVMRCMTDAYRYEELMAMDVGLRKYMLHDLSAIMVTTILFCCGGGDEPERKAAYLELWQHINDTDPALYHYLTRRGLPAAVTWMPWKIRGKVSLTVYKALCKIVKLG